MSAFSGRAALLAFPLLLAGCAAQVPPAQVTRFHLGQPIAKGEVAVEARDTSWNDSLEFRTYAAAISAELARTGFSIAPGLAKSELVAVVDVQSRTRPAGYAERGSGVSIGLGGGSGGYGGGVGIGGAVSFPIGKKRSNDLESTELGVQLKRRSDSSVIWEGRARLEARDGTPYATTEAAVRKLAAALFTGFPGESGRTIIVK